MYVVQVTRDVLEVLLAVPAFALMDLLLRFMEEDMRRLVKC